jgi:predicted CxxxxCH...CXXCH cytochrome family protein
MNRSHDYFAVSHIFALFGVLSAIIVSGCGDVSTSPQGSTPNTVTVARTTSIATGNDVNMLPLRGKQRLKAAPDKAVIGMIYINTTDNREYIFDGSEWVPHDKSADNFYKTKTEGKTAAYPGGPYSAGHVPHSAYTCNDCHRTVNMVVYFFDLTSSRAYIKPTLANPNPPKPVYNGNMFDATKPKTCSNIACHGISAGTYSYYFPGGDGEPELKTVTYDGSVAVTPLWNSTGAGCTACHGNPPSANAWHSGYHGNQGPSGAYNQCQFCHPDATGSNGHGTAITNLSQHADRIINVQVAFKSSCFGCH